MSRRLRRLPAGSPRCDAFSERRGAACENYGRFQVDGLLVCSIHRAVSRRRPLRDATLALRLGSGVALGLNALRSGAELRRRIAEVEADERFHYPPARVDVNAPLALIQVEGKAVVQALRWALGELPGCAYSYRAGLGDEELAAAGRRRDELQKAKENHS